MRGYRACAGALLVVWALLQTGCASEDWRFKSFDEIGYDLLWQSIIDVLQYKGGYAIAEEKPVEGTIETRWKDSLVPFSRGGYRQRAFVKVDREEGGRSFLVGIRVEKELNVSMNDPLDPEGKDWSRASDDSLEAQILLQHLDTLLGGHEGSPIVRLEVLR